MLKLDIVTVILGVFILLTASKEFIEIFTYFKKKFRISVGLEKDKKDIVERINTLELHDQWQSEEIMKISKGIDKIQRQLLDKKIDDYRWDILEFASGLSGGRKYNKEQFEHVIKIDQMYEDILDEIGGTNGQVTDSMEIVHEEYKKLLKGELKNGGN